MIEQTLQKEIMKGISPDLVEKIKQDIWKFNHSYVTDWDFKMATDMHIEDYENKIR